MLTHAIVAVAIVVLLVLLLVLFCVIRSVFMFTVLVVSLKSGLRSDPNFHSGVTCHCCSHFFTFFLSACVVVFVLVDVTVFSLNSGLRSAPQFSSSCVGYAGFSYWFWFCFCCTYSLCGGWGM